MSASSFIGEYSRVLNGVLAQVPQVLEKVEEHVLPVAFGAAAGAGFAKLTFSILAVTPLTGALALGGAILLTRILFVYLGAQKWFGRMNLILTFSMQIGVGIGIIALMQPISATAAFCVICGSWTLSEVIEDIYLTAKAYLTFQR
jgi:hypothetical protein